MTGDSDTTESTRDRMGAVSHTNPYTGETVGQLFQRGPTVAADGGRPNAVDDDTDGANRTMGDVSHTPPKDAEGANRAFERGVVDE